MTDIQVVLTEVERSELAQCEAVIERGRLTFLEVGNALAQIRDQRLYRASHGTFEDYCRERWGMSRQRAHQHIEAAEVVTSLSTMVDIPLPANERQARALAEVPAEQRSEVWQEAVETAPNGKVTAALIRQANEGRYNRILERVVERVVDEMKAEQEVESQPETQARPEPDSEPIPQPEPVIPRGRPLVSGDDIQNMSGILMYLEKLAETFSAQRFRQSVALAPHLFTPHLRKVRSYIPAVRALLDEIERED